MATATIRKTGYLFEVYGRSRNDSLTPADQPIETVAVFADNYKRAKADATEVAKKFRNTHHSIYVELAL